MPIGCGQLDHLCRLRACWLLNLFQRVQTHAKIGSRLGHECVDVVEASVLVSPAKLAVSCRLCNGHIKEDTRSRIIPKLPCSVAKRFEEERGAFTVQFLFLNSDEPITHSPRLARSTL